jgi:hypothetical protein
MGGARVTVAVRVLGLHRRHQQRCRARAVLVVSLTVRTAVPTPVGLTGLEGSVELARVYVSLIQSDFTAGRHGNFEAVIVEDGQLWYWYRDNRNVDLAWTPDNSEVRLPWIRAQRVTGERDNVAGPGCIIQSASSAGQRGNFEVVVPLRLASGAVELQHFYRDNNDSRLPWVRGQRVTGGGDEVAGPGCIIQSASSAGQRGNFEVVVPLRLASGAVALQHFYRDNSFDHLPSPLRQRLTMSVHAPWVRGFRVTGDEDFVAGPACLIQSTFGPEHNRRFDVAVPLHLADGSIELCHFFRDNSDLPGPWTKSRFITQSCAGFGCIIQSSFGAAGYGDFEVLVDECYGSVVHYWHLNAKPDEVWIRTNRFTILGRHALRAHRAKKVVQLTGEFDREGWNGTGTPKFAFNRTKSRFGIIGTDLGVSFPHDDRLYFLFGDTQRVGYSDPDHDDAMAFCTGRTVDDGLRLTFLPQPPLVPGISQDAFEVPLDGVSWNDSMYVFFSTDHRAVGKYIMMGRSILARSDDDGPNFTFLYEVSRYKFINVSAMIVDGYQHGLPGDGPQLVVFGSGRYRSSDVYLAVKPAAEIAERGGFLFYAGGRGQPSWSHDEDDAVPLFGEACVGELSVRWNSLLGVWLCLYNADWPADRSAVGGIVMRWSRRPYGPWSTGDVIFSVNDGLGKFMHLPGVDHTQDRYPFDRSGDLGGMYGPYQIPQYTHWSEQGSGVRIYFTMSTANPYQTMLMTASIPSALA